MLSKHLQTALQAMRDDESICEYEPRKVQIVNGVTLTIFERRTLPQSAASFALRHRVLPATDATGLRLWPCAESLLKHFIQPTVLMQMASAAGRPLRLVELGAGTGFLGIGIAAALGPACAERVVLTDPAFPMGGGSTSLTLLEKTVAANVTVAPSAVACKLLWGDACDVAALHCAHGPFDVAFGSELLYREDSVGALVQTVRSIDTPRVVLAQQTRPSGSMALDETCIALMQDAGYRLVERLIVPRTTAVIYTYTRVRR